MPNLPATAKLLAFFLFFSAFGPCLGRGYGQPASPQEALAAGMEEDLALQWVWGEVTSVDAQNNELKIKYIDYETDMERETSITVDFQTTYGNFSAFSDIKPKDTVSVDYAVSPEGKNIAKNISLEKPEDLPEEAVPLE